MIELSFTHTATSSLIVQGTGEQIGRAAAGAGVVLTELRPAEGAGLEEMFLQLTADDARDEVPS